MKQKYLSTLGYLMDQMDIPTVSVAQAIHVDASLVSKWKTGSRNLSSRSLYFDNVIECLIDYDRDNDCRFLKAALRNLYPKEDPEGEAELKLLLREALSQNPFRENPKENDLLLKDSNTINVSVYKNNEGRRQAILGLLDYALTMEIPGEFYFLETEDFEWLLEERSFCAEFTRKLKALSDKGFRSEILLYDTPNHMYYARLFDACSPLIFHKNIHWHFLRYYDEMLINTSFYLLNHAISVVGLNSENSNSATMVYTDRSQVLTHEVYVQNALEKSSRLFTSYKNFDLPMPEDPPGSLRHNGALYSYLPAPAFIFSDEALLTDILRSNQVPGDRIKVDLKKSEKLKKFVYDARSEHINGPFIYLFQLETMIKRAMSVPFKSCSLSLLEGRTITVTKGQYERMLKNLLKDVSENPDIQVYLLSEKDGSSLPSVSCWCKEGRWMLLMDREAVQVCEDVYMADAAAVTMARTIRKLPPERRNRQYTSEFLINLITEMEKNS